MKNNLGADLKIVIVGNSGTGKTSFVNKWTKNIFSDKYKATIVSDFAYKIININGVIYRIQLWDLAGQDRNTCVAKIFCKDAHGAIIVSDCTNRNSFIETEKWKSCIDENSKFVDSSDLPILLIENKYDLINQVVNPFSEADLKEFADKNNFISSFRCSAKEGVNVNESMDYLIKSIIKKMQTLGPDGIKKPNNNIKIKKENKQKKNDGCC